MKISIITVCFNSEDTIISTLNSVFSQDYPYIEHIIVDGGSSDRTMDIVNQYPLKNLAFDLLRFLSSKVVYKNLLIHYKFF